MNPRAEQYRIDRLEQIIFGADFQTPHNAWNLVQCRNDDDGDFPQRWIRLNALQHLESVKLRHQHV